MQVDHTPAAGEKVDARAVTAGPGGQIATAVLTCAGLGLRTAFTGVVGDDEAGVRAQAPLRAAGVECAGVQRVSGVRTRGAWILVESFGERTLVADRAPELRLASAGLSRRAVEDSALLLLDTEDLDVARWALDVARPAGVPVLLDAEGSEAALFDLVRQVDFPVLSKGLAERFSGDGSYRDGLRKAAGEGTVMAVATLGAQGAAAWQEGLAFELPAPRVPVVDTTGAGDVFRGALAWALLRGAGARAALASAVAAGAHACTAIGAQGALPTTRLLEPLLARGDRTSEA